MDLLVNGMTVEINMLQSGDDKLKSVVSVMGEEIISVMNGDQAYKIQGGQKIDIMPREIEQIQKKFPAKILLLPELKNNLAALEKEGKLYYTLENVTEKFTFDAESGLLVEREDTLEKTTTQYSDWKSYDGILYPSKTIILTVNQRLVQNVKSLSFNKAIPDSEFN